MHHIIWWCFVGNTFWRKFRHLSIWAVWSTSYRPPSIQSVVCATQMSGTNDPLGARGSIWDTALRAIYYYCDGSFTLCQSHTLFTEHHKQSGTLPSLWHSVNGRPFWLRHLINGWRHPVWITWLLWANVTSSASRARHLYMIPPLILSVMYRCIRPGPKRLQIPRINEK